MGQVCGVKGGVMVRNESTGEYFSYNSRGDTGMSREKTMKTRSALFFPPSDGHRKVLVPGRVERELLDVRLFADPEVLGPLLPVRQVSEDERRRWKGG